MNPCAGQLCFRHGGHRKKTIVHTDPIDRGLRWGNELRTRRAREAAQRAIGEPSLVDLLQVLAVVPLGAPDRICVIGPERHRCAEHQLRGVQLHRFTPCIFQLDACMEQIIGAGLKLFCDPDSSLISGNHCDQSSSAIDAELRILEAVQGKHRQIHSVIQVNHIRLVRAAAGLGFVMVQPHRFQSASRGECVY